MNHVHPRENDNGVTVAVNGRFVHQRVTGQQRYGLEIISRLKDKFTLVAPEKALGGMRGHLWEQTVLPFRLQGKLLWSPSATGPLSVGRQVVTIHDAIPLDHPEWFSWRFAKWYGALLPLLMHRVRHVLTVSEYSRARLIEHSGIPEEKITAIHLGVDERFSPAGPERVASLRQRLNLPERYALMVASLQPRKNLARLLKAWEIVQESLGGAELVLAGASSPQFAGTDLAHLPNRVRLIGYVDDADLPPLYSGATVFVYPSICEGFGLPPLEAMACGAPVVTSKDSSLPEVVGDAAVLVDPYDVESIADGIRRVFDDEILRESLRSRSIARARQFTWQRTADATWNVLCKTFKNSGAVREKEVN